MCALFFHIHSCVDTAKIFSLLTLECARGMSCFRLIPSIFRMLIPFRCMQWWNCDGFRVVLYTISSIRLILFAVTLSRMNLCVRFNWFEMHMLPCVNVCQLNGWQQCGQFKFLRPTGHSISILIAPFQFRLTRIGSVYGFPLLLRPHFGGRWETYFFFFLLSFYLANWIWLNNECSFNDCLIDGCVRNSQNGGTFFSVHTLAKEVAQQARIKTNQRNKNAEAKSVRKTKKRNEHHRNAIYTEKDRSLPLMWIINANGIAHVCIMDSKSAVSH